MTTFSAQQLLDQFHEIGILLLFEPNLDQKSRFAHLILIKQKLRNLKHLIKQEKDTIKARWNARNPLQQQEQRLELKPYLLLETLLSQASVDIAALELASKATTSLPNPPEYGTIIWGDHSRLVDEFEIVNQSSLEQRRANENYERARRAELLQQEQAEEEQSRAQREYRRLKQAEQFKQQQAEEERQRLQRRADFDQARADTELAKLNPGMFRPKAILIENRQQAIRRNLEHARKLIDRHQYAEATTYLLLIDHPKAREWLSKLDALDKSQFESPQETRSPRVNIRLKLKIARESALIKYLSKTLILLFWGTILVISLLVITFSFVGGTTCSDGWRSSSHGSGTCSHHGGIR